MQGVTGSDPAVSVTGSIPLAQPPTACPPAPAVGASHCHGMSLVFMKGVPAPWKESQHHEMGPTVTELPRCVPGPPLPPQPIPCPTDTRGWFRLLRQFQLIQSQLLLSKALSIPGHCCLPLPGRYRGAFFGSLARFREDKAISTRWSPLIICRLKRDEAEPRW